jgi:hypothetical protein
MTSAEQFELVEAAAREVVERGHGAVFELSLDLGSAIALIGTLQLALRHPGVTGSAAVTSRYFIDGLIQRIDDAGFPTCAKLAAMGDDPRYDT